MKHTDGKAPRRFGRTDRLAQAFDAGPFSGIEVAPFPATLVELVERQTGKPFDARLFEAYERVRAFVAFQAVIITPNLRTRQVLSDPMLQRAARPPTVAGRTPSRRLPPRPATQQAQAGHAASGDAFDPSDLGDD